MNEKHWMKNWMKKTFDLDIGFQNQTAKTTKMDFSIFFFRSSSMVIWCGWWWWLICKIKFFFCFVSSKKWFNRWWWKLFFSRFWSFFSASFIIIDTMLSTSTYLASHFGFWVFVCCFWNVFFLMTFFSEFQKFCWKQNNHEYDENVDEIFFNKTKKKKLLRLTLVKKFVCWWWWW